MLALSNSIIRCNGLTIEESVIDYIDYFSSSQRQYSENTSNILRVLQSNEVSLEESSKYIFKEGSWGSGGIVRATPIPFFYKDYSNSFIQNVMQGCLYCTHSHPEAIEAAFIQAIAIKYLFEQSPRNFNPKDFIKTLAVESLSTNFRNKLLQLLVFLEKIQSKKDITDSKITRFLLKDYIHQRSNEAFMCSFWYFLRYYNDPVECLINAINKGGDTTAVGSIVGALLGALYGTNWILKKWFDYFG